MSTTVTYKGSTIATAENQTKTLLTEGKYLEDDITIVDVTSGGGGATLITKNISANGTYNASSDSADGYSQVNVAVPNTYTAGDEGKVVSSGALVSQSSITKNANGTYDTTLNNEVVINVPNSYSAGDEGKVVSNGALVAQTVHADVTPTTSDQTIDTTTNNSIKVKGDADLIATNIKKDVEIFGITGSYEGSGGGGDGVIETGTFTIESDTKNVTLQHGLGAVPDFCIVYPIDTPTATSSYRMNFQVLLIGLGQANYNISTNASTNLVSPHNMAGGSGYNTGVYGQFNQSAPQSGYAGTATTTTIKVGGINETSSGGTLTAGTYGYIVGVLS